MHWYADDIQIHGHYLAHKNIPAHQMSHLFYSYRELMVKHISASQGSVLGQLFFHSIYYTADELGY